MKTVRRAALLSVVGIAWIVASAALTAVQEPAAVARPVLTPEQMEDFLLRAKVIKTKPAGKGVTDAKRATLSDGRITHDAEIQTVNVSKLQAPGNRGATELNFKDSYRFNIAGYRLALLLGLDNVPMSVERNVDGSPAAVTWWIDDVFMDENDRWKGKKQNMGPDPTRTAEQVHIMRVFDELIENTDRNGGNLLWTKDWKMWMIDHTLAFRLDEKLFKPQLLERCERGLLEKMRGLTAETLTRELGDSLEESRGKALLARRDAIVKWFDGLIAQRGEGAILYTLKQR